MRWRCSPVGWFVSTTFVFAVVIAYVHPPHCHEPSASLSPEPAENYPPKDWSSQVVAVSQRFNCQYSTLAAVLRVTQRHM